jgi:PTS system fructose-specific IIA component/PTS system nitrogen regulatory IIA component
MKLTEIIAADAVIPELEATDRDAVLREMVKTLAKAKKIVAKHVDDVVKQLAEREKQGTTGIGKGVAVPHVRHDAVKQVTAAVARSSRGVDFGSLDQQPVYLFFLVLAPDNSKYFQAMETIFRHVQKDNFRKFLRQAETREDVLDLLREADQQSEADG